MKPKVSIIIVHYNAAEELFNCLASIKSSAPNVAYEVIVVDNDEKQTINQNLLTRFPNIHYIKALTNIGFGSANNLGAKKAKGKYLLFINPDVLVTKYSIDLLENKISQDKRIGIIAPQLIDEKDKIIMHQCSDELTPTSLLFSHSLIHRLFPNNRIAKIFWKKDWDRKNDQYIENVQGSTLMISNKLFQNLNGFDENFFLYFEDNDLCRRVRKKDYRILYFPKSRMVHLGGISTKDKVKSLKYFKKSRKYYFVKHFSLSKGLITHAIMSFLENKIIFILIMLTTFVVLIMLIQNIINF